MRVVITGAAGFIGSRLSEMLVDGRSDSATTTWSCSTR